MGRLSIFVDAVNPSVYQKWPQTWSKPVEREWEAYKRAVADHGTAKSRYDYVKASHGGKTSNATAEEYITLADLAITWAEKTLEYGNTKFS